MRSVTWLVISSTVAPGQLAWTIIVLMVKGGILLAAEVACRTGRPPTSDREHQVPDERPVPERPFGQVEAVHGGLEIFTVWPGDKAVHAGGDDAIAGREAAGHGDRAWRSRPRGHLAQRHRLGARVDHPDEGLAVAFEQRRGRQIDPRRDVGGAGDEHGRAQQEHVGRIVERQIARGGCAWSDRPPGRSSRTRPIDTERRVEFPHDRECRSRAAGLSPARRERRTPLP